MCCVMSIYWKLKANLTGLTMYINVVVVISRAFSFRLKLKCRCEYCDTFLLNVTKQLAPHMNLGVSNYPDRNQPT